MGKAYKWRMTAQANQVPAKSSSPKKPANRTAFKKGEKKQNQGKRGPNKVTKALKEMILGALDDAGGQKYLAQQAIDNPGPFMALVGKVLPTTLAGDPSSPIVIQLVSYDDDQAP